MPQVEVKTYKTVKDYERDATARLEAGWQIEGQIQDPGRTHRAKRAGNRGLVASLFLPGIGGAAAAASGLLSNKKDGTITITWVRGD